MQDSPVVDTLVYYTRGDERILRALVALGPMLARGSVMVLGGLALGGLMAWLVGF